MRKIRLILALFILNCLLLGGCGGESVNDSRADSTRDSGTESANGSGTESTDGSKGTSTVSEGENMLSVKEIRSIHFEKQEEGYKSSNTFYNVMGDKIYLFRVEYLSDETGNGNGSDRLCVQVYDSKTQKVKQYVLAPEVPGYEEYGISSAGLTSDGEISLKLTVNSSPVLVKTDLQGTVLEVSDPFPDETEYPWNPDSWLGDKVFHLTDGRTIISRWDNAVQSAVLTWYGGENSGQAFGRLEGINPGAFCCGEDGILYCLAGDSLFRWDVAGNAKEELFRLHENGVEFSSRSGLILTGEGDILLGNMNEGSACVYVLTDQKIEYDEEIRLSCVLSPSGSSYIQKRASTFAHETGSVPIVVEKEKGKYQEDYKNRIFAELSAGKGPEIMWLSREDMIMLAEKGALCDLSDMIPADIKEEMIPGALELGMVDGKLVGFTPQIEVYTMMTSDKTWAGDSWSVDDFMELAVSNENMEMLASFEYSTFDPYGLLFWIFLRDLESSPWLDLEQGISHFDSEEFIQVLELCKKYGTDTDLDLSEHDTMLREGRLGASLQYLGSGFVPFSEVMSRLGEGCHIVGIPKGNGGSGNYVREYSGGCLAVNANVEHKEEIAEFIAYLLDYDYQFTVDGCSVRMDVTRNSVIYGQSLGYGMRFSSSLDNPMVKRLEVKPDGTPWLEEFLDFLENCEPEPVRSGQIMHIIYEESDAYFNGDKNAKEAADIIHNRIQLYLDENS